MIRTTFDAIIWVWIAWFMLYLGFIGALIYVAIHLLSKYW